MWVMGWKCIRRMSGSYSPTHLSSIHRLQRLPHLHPPPFRQCSQPPAPSPPPAPPLSTILIYQCHVIDHAFHSHRSFWLLAMLTMCIRAWGISRTVGMGAAVWVHCTVLEEFGVWGSAVHWVCVIPPSHLSLYLTDVISPSCSSLPHQHWTSSPPPAHLYLTNAGCASPSPPTHLSTSPTLGTSSPSPRSTAIVLLLMLGVCHPPSHSSLYLTDIISLSQTHIWNLIAPTAAKPSEQLPLTPPSSPLSTPKSMAHIKYAISKQQKTNAPVSPPTSHSGLVRTEPPVSRGHKCTQSTVDTTAEPATKKPAITADEEAADNSAKQGKGDGGKGRGGKKRGRGGHKTAGDKDKEDKAASDAANKDKSKA
ncbi:hypothetical protein BDQ17DRAFT_1460735 [Cyathus striatus]|nr:hypothetical protein BDQ17DRAFT_1460735 [Cyathus striatus]